MRNERVVFAGTQGSRLSARLSLPPDGNVVASALFAHCFTCSKDLSSVVNISEALTQQRIAVLRFDFTGLGESEGDFAGTTFSSNVGDLIAAAEYMQRELEPPSILIGHSLGGAAVLQAASSIDSVRGVATIGAPFDPAHVKHLFANSLSEIEERGEADVVLAGRRFTVSRADEPVAAGGDDLGPTPYDLLAAALGACTTMTVRMYAERKNWPLEEAVVRPQHSRVHAQDEKACETREARMDRLDRELTFVGPLDAAHRGRLLEIAERCPVHRTLSAGVRITTRSAGDLPTTTVESQQH